MIRVMYIAVGGKYGSDLSLFSLLRALRNEIDPYVIMDRDLGFGDILRREGIPFHVIRMYPYMLPDKLNAKNVFLYLPRVLRTFLGNFFASRKLLKLSKEIKPDIIHTNTGVYRNGYFLARKIKIGHIWHLREYIDLDLHFTILGGRASFSKLLKKQINIPVPITKGIANYFYVQEKYVVYDGVKNIDELVFHEIKRPYFLFVGSIQKGKGLLDLLEAFGNLKLREGDEVKLYIAGKCYDRDYEMQIRTFLESKENLENRIIFLGERSDIDELMSYSLATIVPSYHEALGRVVIEAMFNGCLVIGRDTNGIKEQFDNGLKLCGSEIGLRFKNREQLSEHMETVLEKGAESYFSIIKNAQSCVAKLYLNKISSASILENYRFSIKNTQNTYKIK